MPFFYDFSALLIMNKEIITNHFVKFVPKQAAPILASWVIKHKVNVIVKPKRKTKLGDFRPSLNGIPPQITINNDLPPYNFLLTFVHEFAHLIVWENYQNKVEPHGKEWQKTFRDLVFSFLDANVFPEPLAKVISKHLEKPKSSSCYDAELVKALERFSEEKKASTYVEDIELSEVFQLENDHRWFKKIKKLRTRFLCEEIDSKKLYRISAHAHIKAQKPIE